MDTLMGIERQAEMDETANLLERFTFKELERRNLAVAKLYVKEVSTGVYGRVIVTLTRNKHGGDKKNTKDTERIRTFTPGDIVGLFENEHGGTSDLERIGGIVHKVWNDEIHLSYNQMYEFEALKQPIAAIKLANEVTYSRCKKAL
jgi:hypothetical protein